GARPPKAVLLGGAAGSFLRPDQLDLPLTFEDARAAGTTLGSGVVIVYDESSDLVDAVLRIAAFFRDESCGQCVPCRVGTIRQEQALHRLAEDRAIGVEVEGARVLVPSCSRKVEAGMAVHTDSPRVRTSRRLVLELLGSSVDLSTAPEAQEYVREYGAEPDRFGKSATVAQPVKVDNDL